MKKILLTLAIICMHLLTFSQDFDQITKAFSNGNVSQLVALLNSEVDLTISGSSSQLGRAEVEDKLRAFFMAHQPKTMKIIHKGVSKKEVHYFIGQLVTTDETFRVTVYLSKVGESFLIESLEIEK